jgi:DNA-binding HxlR family transcriptional regulator
MERKFKHDDGFKHDSEECKSSLSALDDALYVIGGKWKLRIIGALREYKRQRFNELQRTLHISSKVLSNELKQLEMNGFVARHVSNDNPAVAEYELTDYCDTLSDVLGALIAWGSMHRRKIQHGEPLLKKVV